MRLRGRRRPEGGRTEAERRPREAGHDSGQSAVDGECAAVHARGELRGEKWRPTEGEADRRNHCRRRGGESGGRQEAGARGEEGGGHRVVHHRRWEEDQTEGAVRAGDEAGQTARVSRAELQGTRGMGRQESTEGNMSTYVHFVVHLRVTAALPQHWAGKMASL